MTKNWTRSRTILLNSLTLAVSVLTVVSGSELVADYPKAAAAIVAALAAANIALRFITSRPIG